MQIAVTHPVKIQLPHKLQARLAARKRRKAVHAQLMQRLDSLTDYTLIDRMYDDHKLNSTRRQTWPQSS